MSDTPFTLDVRHLSRTTFEQLLNDMSANCTLKAYEITARAACGDGVASTADRINLSLSFDKNPHNVPEQLVFKTLLLTPLLRFSLPAILSLSSVVRGLEKLPVIGSTASKLLFVIIGVFQKYCPQAPDAMYEIESRFYRDIRPQLNIEAPQVYGAKYDHHTRHFAVLMEDLSLRQAHFPNATESLSITAVKSTLKQMASLHAQYWQCPKLENKLSWVPTRLQGGMFPVFDGIGYDLIRYQVDQFAFKQALIAPLGKTVEELWEANWRAQRLLAQGPQTLLHGDTHVGNTYVLNNGDDEEKGGLIDFQLLVKGHWAIDVCYYIMTALSIKERREHERDLYAYYLNALSEAGVAQVPNMDEAWQAHRIASIWGLVIGWLITPTVNYGEAITYANIERLATALADLDAFNAL